jgi:hypothetical protein
VQVREAAPDDVPAIQAIYAHHVLHGLATFEEEPPSVDEMRRRFEEVRSRRLPWLAADFGGALIGYGYCAPYRTRSAYRFTLEDSIYVRQGSEGRGVGPTCHLDDPGRRPAIGQEGRDRGGGRGTDRRAGRQIAETRPIRGAQARSIEQDVEHGTPESVVRVESGRVGARVASGEPAVGQVGRQLLEAPEVELGDEVELQPAVGRRVVAAEEPVAAPARARHPREPGPPELTLSPGHGRRRHQEVELVRAAELRLAAEAHAI